MSLTLQTYRAHAKTIPSFFKKIYGGLNAEKYYYHEIMRPDCSRDIPKEAVAILWITTLYASREKGGWQITSYYFYLDVNGSRIEQPHDCMRIYEKVDDWLDEVRLSLVEQNIVTL